MNKRTQKPMKFNQIMVGPKTVAALIGISERTLYNWVKKGVFPSGTMIGSRQKWTVKAVQQWIKKQTVFANETMEEW